MRILFLTNAITPDRMGGLERYVRELAGALVRAGAEVVVCARRIDPEHPELRVEEDGVVVRRFATPSKRNPGYALMYPFAATSMAYGAARRAGRRSILHSHFPLQGFPLALSGQPFVHTFQAPVFRELLPEHKESYLLPAPVRPVAVRSLRAAESLTVRRAARVVTLSAYMANEAEQLGAVPSRMELVPGGIDTDAFSPGKPVEDPWASGAGPLLFAARRLVPRTGVLELIEAAKSIVEQVPGARLGIAGGGPLEQAARERIAALGLDRQVRLLGWISDEELIGWYRAADLAVLPTQELEGFGLVTAEAMACGTPCVGTPAGATPEVLARLDRTLLTRGSSPAAIADTISALLQDRDRLSKLAERARAAVHPELSWSAVADRHMAMYERHESDHGLPTR